MPDIYIKHCHTHRAYLNELYVYETAYPNKAKLIEVQEPDTLVLSKLVGKPYLDLKDLTGVMVTKLAKAISKFHSLRHMEDIVLCHWDNQPHNILWSDAEQKIYLLDFEDIRLAYPEADIVHLFLFWAEIMRYEMFELMTQCFLEQYKSKVPLDLLRWKGECRKAKARFDMRRRKYNKKEGFDNPSRNLNRKYLCSEAIFKA